MAWAPKTKNGCHGNTLQTAYKIIVIEYEPRKALQNTKVKKSN